MGVIAKIFIVMGVIAVGILLGGIVMGVIAMGLLLWGYCYEVIVMGVIAMGILLWGYCYGVIDMGILIWGPLLWDRSPNSECPEFKPLSYWQRQTYMLNVATSFNILCFFHSYFQNWSQTKPLKLHKIKRIIKFHFILVKPWKSTC